MASNFRGTQRTLYNPKTVKYLEPREARKEYQALRRVAQKRQARLEKAGVEGPLVNFEFPKSSELTDDQIQSGLLDVSRFLRDPLTFVGPAKEAQAAGLPEGKERVFDRGRTYVRNTVDMGPIINRNKKAYGDFMDMVRARAGGRAAYKERVNGAMVRASYEQAVKRGMRPKTLAKHFSEYLTDREKAQDLAKTLYNAPDAGRLTISALEGMLKK